MKKSKSRLALVLALVLMVSLFAACGNTSTPTPTPTTGGTDATPTPAGTTTEAPPAGDATPVPANKVHRLSFSLGDPSTSSKAIYYQELADRTLEATNGGLEITIFSGGTLFSHFECREGVLSGAADMGWFVTTFAPGQYPLAEAITLPLQFDNQLALTYAFGEMVKENPDLQAELSELKICNVYAGPGNQLFTDRPITKPDDLKGLSIRSVSGTPADLLTAWGASCVFIGMAEVYEAMDKGTIQGFLNEWSGIASNTLYEVFDYELMLPLWSNPFLIIMNQNSYDNIPAEYKDAFDEIWCSDAAATDYAKIFADEVVTSREKGRSEYGIEATEPDVEAFNVAASELVQKWFTDMTTADFDAEAYFNRIVELYDEGCAKFPEYNP